MQFYFYSPQAFEPWDYRNPIEKGIGGSETAHIEVALRLAKRGHEVTSFSPLPKDTDREYGGVTWSDLTEADFSKQGIWVSSRAPWIADEFELRHQGQELWLVMQDVKYKELTEERGAKFDRLFPLCSTHFRYTEQEFPFTKGKLYQSANGVRTDAIEAMPLVKRDPKRLIYASSPDRGLIGLIKIFKKAYAQDPSLSLHIFYGFDNISKIVKQDRAYDMYGNTEEKLLKSAEHPGITWHGRKGQLELYTEWMKSGVWCYPTNFTETSCITSMDAQACGAIPLTAPLWALADNVEQGTLITGDAEGDPLTQCRYVNELLRLVNEDWEEDRAAMMHRARDRFNWERIVDQYETYAKK